MVSHEAVFWFSEELRILNSEVRFTNLQWSFISNHTLPEVNNFTLSWHKLIFANTYDAQNK